jgi:Uma2 family endonuclease
MALRLKRWTLTELHRLPDDGNKYEVVDGELFVTPAPSESHETIASLLTRILDPYVHEHDLGLVYRPRAVVRVKRSEVEPDLYVRARTRRPTSWAAAPLPILVVEILSPTTRRRDHLEKRRLYVRSGIPEYWIVDEEDRMIRVIRPDRADVVAKAKLVWRPAGVKRGLSVDVRGLFQEALGPSTR